MVDGIQARQPGSVGPAAGSCRARRRRGQHDHFRAERESAADRDSALTALLQTTDMIRDARGDDWAQMIRARAGHRRSSSGIRIRPFVLAAAYGEAAENVDVPDRAQAMSDAARREANLTLKLDPEDAGAYAFLSGLEPTYDYALRKRFCCAALRFAKHPKQPLGALYSYEATLLGNVGRLREALSFQLIAHAIDEWGAPKTAQLARAYANMGNLPAARDWLQKGVQLWPNHSGVRRAQRYIAGFYEQPAEPSRFSISLDAQIRPTKASGDLAKLHRSQGGAFRALTAAAIRRSAPRPIGAKSRRENEIMMLAGAWRNQAGHRGGKFRARPSPAVAALVPVHAGHAEHAAGPRLRRLASRMGLIKYWRETGKRPDFCTDPGAQANAAPNYWPR